MHKNSRSGDVFSIVSRTSKRGKYPKKQISEIALAPPCGKCGSEVGKLGAGRKPKESSLYCCQCRKLIKWLSSSELRSLLKAQSVNEILNRSGESQEQVNKPKNKRSPSSGESAFCHSNNGDK